MDVDLQKRDVYKIKKIYVKICNIFSTKRKIIKKKFELKALKNFNNVI